MGKMRELSATELFVKLKQMKELYKHQPSEMLATTIKNIEAKANAGLDAEMAAKEKSFLEKHEGSDWWELAKKQYPITETNDGFVVTSKIVDREHDKQWSFSHKYLAMAKVEQLVHWVHSNRHRGFGDVDVDLERWSTTQ